MYFSLLILHAWYIWYPSENKTSLRHLRIVFKSSYLGKAYVRCLQENLIENNVNVLIKCLRKTWNRRLNQMSTSDVSKTSFKDVLKMDFFNFREKVLFILLLFTYYLLSFLNVEFFLLVTKLPQRSVYDIVAQLMFLQLCVFGVCFGIKYQPWSNVVFLM